MKSIRSLILRGTPLWNELYDPNIEQLWFGKSVMGKGSTGVVYDMGKGKVGKVQKLFATPSPSSNQVFYEHYPSMVYIKESFLHEALIMQELYGKSILIPKVFDVRFGEVQGQFWSLVIMQKVEGRSYIPFQIPWETLHPMIVSFVKELQVLYQTYEFIHGDLITDNMNISTTQQIQLIDFGLSSCVLDGILFCRYHSFKLRLLPTLLQDKKIMSQIRNDVSPFSCPRFFTFLQAHRQSIDLCKLLSPTPIYSHLPSVFQKLLMTCVGPLGHTLGPTRKPNPIYYSQKIITFREALKALEKKT